MDCGYVIYKSGSSAEPACIEFTNKIKGSMYNIAKEFVYIGFLLAECDYFGTYKDWGYSSIHEYALEQLGFKKSSTYNFINVCKAFSANYNNTSIGHSLPFSMIMKDTYANFNYSQLVEMLSMNDKQRSLVTPDMTVKQIREVKKLDDSRCLESVPEEASAPSWVPVFEVNGWYMVCSCCGARWMLDSVEHMCIQTPYCYNCGKKLNSVPVDNIVYK